MLAAVACGGALGAAARHAVTLAVAPGDAAGAGRAPWATLTVNVTGCLLLGALMVLVLERGGVHRLLRPFLGVGVLGGFTTFSAYAVDAHQLLAAGRGSVALVYLVGTLVTALLAVEVAAAGARVALGARPRRADGRGSPARRTR